MFDNTFVKALRRSQISEFDKLHDHRARCNATPERKDCTHGSSYQSCVTLIDSCAGSIEWLLAPPPTPGPAKITTTRASSQRTGTAARWRMCTTKKNRDADLQPIS